LQKHEQLQEFKAWFEVENPEVAERLPIEQKAVIQKERQLKEQALQEQKLTKEQELAKVTQ